MDGLALRSAMGPLKTGLAILSGADVQHPLDARRETLRTELVTRPDGSFQLVGRPVPEPSSVLGIIAGARESESNF